MRQSRLMSLVEAVANVAVGLGVGVATQLLASRFVGLHASVSPEPQAGWCSPACRSSSPVQGDLKLITPAD